ncbi:pyridoxamine 5'-phosphate oxidase family protein [Qipengyuania sp. 1NDH17]|uniref:Pyridoxamine 5'-phosphate oxidase family protein n=1 Tax=Qipengyuania polymorpha TaxID=2867234 RepID=A0ABS7IZU3_9SPHN|nr:pyridoxamine 5'-phosphate oxidase family protein [Qipengyuania polymorpha]MBX7459094.1 pyridoxamine 5'-phosphate oxidase family protein [Qipengyuania polymorpha]
MSDRSLSQIAGKLKSIDVAMLVTKTGSEGAIAARPMSNNKDVSEEDGTSYHFATDDGRIDDDLKTSNQCGATYSSGDFYCAVQGTGRLHRDREVLEKHWVADLEAWFENGLDTEGLILIEVSPRRIDWWEGREEGQLTF